MSHGEDQHADANALTDDGVDPALATGVLDAQPAASTGGARGAALLLAATRSASSPALKDGATRRLLGVDGRVYQ